MQPKVRDIVPNDVLVMLCLKAKQLRAVFARKVSDATQLSVLDDAVSRN